MTETETQIEMGYRFTADFLDFVEQEHSDRVISDQRENGGRVVVLAGLAVPGAFPEAAALLVYLCEDAQAWGTFTLHQTVAAAENHATDIIVTLKG